MYARTLTDESASSIPQEIPMNQTLDRRTDIEVLHTEFPQVPVRIVVAVLDAYAPLTRTAPEAVHAARERLSDALAG